MARRHAPERRCFATLANRYLWRRGHVLEVIESTERIEQILPRLDEMVDGGLITLEKVRVILYRPAKK